MSHKMCLTIAEAVHAAAIRVLRVVRVGGVKEAPAQLSALSVLVFLGPKTMGELAKAEQVKPPTMTRIVDALVRQGLVYRSTATANRRSLRITATSRGRKLLVGGRSRRVNALARRLENLKKQDLAVLEKAAQILGAV